MRFVISKPHWISKYVKRNNKDLFQDEGVLSFAEDHLVFTRDEEFSSHSAAAAVVHGGHANGLIAWKGKNGKTLKEIEPA